MVISPITCFISTNLFLKTDTVVFVTVQYIGISLKYYFTAHCPISIIKLIMFSIPKMHFIFQKFYNYGGINHITIKTYHDKATNKLVWRIMKCDRNEQNKTYFKTKKHNDIDPDTNTEAFERNFVVKKLMDSDEF